MPEPTSRREFLVTTACTGAVLASGCGAEEPDPGGPVGPPSDEPIGDPSKYPDSSRAPINPANTVMPTCSSQSGIVGPAADSIGLNQPVRVPDANLPANLKGRPIYVARDGQGVFAYDMTCPHLGCLPVFQADRNRWECPCHYSTFTVTGVVTGGPAADPRYAPVPRWPVCTGSDGLVRIDTTKRAP